MPDKPKPPLVDRDQAARDELARREAEGNVVDQQTAASASPAEAGEDGKPEAKP